MQIVGLHSWEIRCHLREHPAPQAAGMHQHIVLVHQRQSVTAGGGQFEGIAHHALHPESGVHADLGGDFCRSAGAKRPTIAGVQAFGALPHHHEVDLAPANHRIRQRRRLPRIQSARAQVDVLIQSEPQSEQQAAFEQSGRDLLATRGGAHRPQDDRIVPGQFGQRVVIQHFTRREPVLSAQIEVVELELVGFADRLQHPDCLADDLRADAVARDDGDAGAWAR